jgi:hypothetical protein
MTLFRRYNFTIPICSVLEVCIATCNVTAGGVQDESQGRRIAQKILPSVAVVKSFDEDSSAIALGSGFLVRASDVATNLHVVKGASIVLVRFVGENVDHEVKGVVAVDFENDLVILRLDDPGKGWPLTLGNSNDTRIGDDVYVAGSPIGLEGTFSRGIVSGRRGNEYIQVTAPISEGSSGGPVVNNQGDVIGVATAQMSEGQNLNFAVPANHLVQLIKETRGLKSPTRLPIHPRFDGFYRGLFDIENKGKGQDGEAEELFGNFRFYEDGTVVHFVSVHTIKDLFNSDLWRVTNEGVNLSTYRRLNSWTIDFDYLATLKFVIDFSGRDAVITLRDKSGDPEMAAQLYFIRCNFP